MAGIKRKQLNSDHKTISPSKKVKSLSHGSNHGSLTGKKGISKPAKSKTNPVADDLIESDTTESENGFYGFSAKEDDNEAGSVSSVSESATAARPAAPAKRSGEQAREKKENTFLDEHGHLKSSSKEAHAQQKVLARQRKAAKPNADSIARAKVLWERLRRKSHVPLEERKKLVQELFDIVTGRVEEFVFKHDSTRIIQCALKYGNLTQRKVIAKELKGHFRSLSESKYGKHLVAKLVVEGDEEIKASIIGEFYGHVKKLINHPEASWILDDIYRAAASKDQKAALLREWYGTEFALFRTNIETKSSADLAAILAESPEKRKPIMDFLQNMINQLIQKKLTGFTMLHDAMLQYYLNCKPGSEEAGEFLEKLKGEGDEEEKDFDLLKNLAFTASGSRVISLAFAHGTAKDRRNMLKVYKDMVDILSPDAHGHKVLLVASEVVDDTVALTKALFAKYLVKGEVSAQLQESILQTVLSKQERIPVLSPLALKTSGGSLPKWLLPPADMVLLEEVFSIRATTSKKDPNTRRNEIVSVISPALLATVTGHAATLAGTPEGCQFITEVLLGADGDQAPALQAVASLASEQPQQEGHISQDSGAGRMLKTVIQGGHFDQQSKKVHHVRDSSSFCEQLWQNIEPHVLSWASGPGVWVVLALVEQDGWSAKDKLLGKLQAGEGQLKSLFAKQEKESKALEKSKDGKESHAGVKAVVSGMRILLQKLH